MVVRVLKLEFYVPRALERTPDIKMKELLKKASLNIKVKKFVINKNGEVDLKSKILWKLSGTKRIMYSIFLYPQLVVFGNDKPTTFYPQARVRQEIGIKGFGKFIERRD